MFANPNTLWIEILAIVLVIGFLSFIIGRYIYKRVNHLPTGDCACCHKGTKAMIKEYHKQYSKEK